MALGSDAVGISSDIIQAAQHELTDEVHGLISEFYQLSKYIQGSVEPQYMYTIYTSSLDAHLQGP